MTRRLTAAVSQPLAVARKLFGSPCKLITTFKSSNISRRRARFAFAERLPGGRDAVATDGQGLTAEGERERASGPFARGNFRSYKKSYALRRAVLARVLLSPVYRANSPFLPPSLLHATLFRDPPPPPLFPSFLSRSFSPAASPRALVAPSPSFSLPRVGTRPASGRPPVPRRPPAPPSPSLPVLRI